MSKRTIEQIRQEVFDEIEHQKMLDDKAEKYRQGKQLVDALHRMAKKASLSSISDDGTVWMYEGTFESMLDVYRAIGAKI